MVDMWIMAWWWCFQIETRVEYSGNLAHVNDNRPTTPTSQIIRDMESILWEVSVVQYYNIIKVQKLRYIKANLRILSNHVQAKMRFSSHVQWTLVSFGHIRFGQIIEIGNYWDVLNFYHYNGFGK